MLDEWMTIGVTFNGREILAADTLGKIASHTYLL